MTGIPLGPEQDIIGMDRGTSAILETLGPNGECTELLAGTIGLGLTRKDFILGRHNRFEISIGIALPARRGGSYDSTQYAEEESKIIFDTYPYLFGFSPQCVSYPVFRREKQAARQEILFRDIYQFSRYVINERYFVTPV